MKKKIFILFLLFIMVFSSCSPNDCPKDEVSFFLDRSAVKIDEMFSDKDVVKYYPEELPNVTLDMLGIQSEYRYFENPSCTDAYQLLVLDFMSAFIDYVSAGPNSSQSEALCRNISTAKFESMEAERDRLKKLVGYTKD